MDEVRQMLDRIKKHITKAIVASVISFGSGAYAGEGWFATKAAYDPNEEKSIITVEGKQNITDHISLYGFLDTLSQQKKPLEFEEYYGEARANYTLGQICEMLDHAGAAAELNTGNEITDTIRLGVTYNPKLWNGSFVFLKAFPYETSEEKGPQLSAYVSQDFNAGFPATASLLVDYNVEPRTTYVEGTLEVEIMKHIRLFAQGRVFSKLREIDEADVEPYIGVKFDF